MRPVPGNASCSRSASPPIRFVGCRRFVGLRSFLAVSSVASGRIEFVLQAPFGLSVLRTSRSLPVALHLTSRSRSYFQLSGGKLRLRGTFTLLRMFTPKRTRAGTPRPATDASATAFFGAHGVTPPVAGFLALRRCKRTLFQTLPNAVLFLLPLTRFGKIFGRVI